MPAAAGVRAEELVESLSSLDTTARLKALRDVKNQIIGNKTKKLSYIKLGAVPRVVEILASGTETPLLLQSAAAVGSFACGNDTGVKALLDSGVLPHLLKMLSNGDTKVVEAGARSLKMIFQSTLAPKKDMVQGQRMELLLKLLNNNNDNVAEVAANVLARCCDILEHQQTIADAGGLQILVSLLSCTIKKREAALEALASLVKNNPHLSMRLSAMDQGYALSTIIGLTKDKSPRTRLLACTCLSNISRAFPSCSPLDRETKTSILEIVVKLLEEPGQVGEDAPMVIADLVANNEELQKAAYAINTIENLCDVLHKGSLPAKQLEGVLLALAELCSSLEDSKKQLLDKGQGPIIAALGHEFPMVKIAACSCIKSITRSVKVRNGHACLTDERLVFPLFTLLDDPNPKVQAAVLRAVSNVVIDFTTTHKSIFFTCGGVGKLVQLARSMDPTLRLNAVWALRNLLYLANTSVKEKVMRELTVLTVVNLIHDSEERVQEQALAFVRNLVCGSIESVEQVFHEEGAILNSVERQLCIATCPDVCIQGLYVLSNVAAGNEFHKESVMSFAAPGVPGPSSLIRFLQDMSNPHLRVAAVWCVTNLVYSDSPGVLTRIARLRDAGILKQLQRMLEDPCLAVKDQVKKALEKFTFDAFF